MRIVAALIAGIATWSLLEYAIHRWLGHDQRFIRNPFGVEHTAHHSRGNYFAPAWKKALVAGGALLLLSWIAAMIVGSRAGIAYSIGLVGFYLYYELFHRLAHIHPGYTGVGRWLRRHHFHHHFHDPRSNHGVTSPLWDHAFGTIARPGMIAVPRKLAMDWLIDPATGALKSEHAGRYSLR